MQRLCCGNACSCTAMTSPPRPVPQLSMRTKRRKMASPCAEHAWTRSPRAGAHRDCYPLMTCPQLRNGYAWQFTGSTPQALAHKDLDRGRSPYALIWAAQPCAWRVPDLKCTLRPLFGGRGKGGAPPSPEDTSRPTSARRLLRALLLLVLPLVVAAVAAVHGWGAASSTRNLLTAATLPLTSRSRATCRCAKEPRTRPWARHTCIPNSVHQHAPTPPAGVQTPHTPNPVMYTKTRPRCCLVRLCMYTGSHTTWHTQVASTGQPPSMAKVCLACPPLAHPVPENLASNPRSKWRAKQAAHGAGEGKSS